jgi:hypothetical protein
LFYHKKRLIFILLIDKAHNYDIYCLISKNGDDDGEWDDGDCDDDDECEDCCVEIHSLAQGKGVVNIILGKNIKIVRH